MYLKKCTYFQYDLVSLSVLITPSIVWFSSIIIFDDFFGLGNFILETTELLNPTVESIMTNPIQNVSSVMFSLFLITMTLSFLFLLPLILGVVLYFCIRPFVTRYKNNEWSNVFPTIQFTSQELLQITKQLQKESNNPLVYSFSKFLSKNYDVPQTGFIVGITDLPESLEEKKIISELMGDGIRYSIFINYQKKIHESK